MSATLDLGGLSTVDNPEVAEVVRLEDSDRADPNLAVRLHAQKIVRRFSPNQNARRASLAAALLASHHSGTLTLAVLNTVGAARDVYMALRRDQPEVELVLLHSRFRSPDRRQAVAAALGPVPADGPGRIVVSTQVVEAGVDVSAATVLTEAAPWASIVQRAGRCNRDGASTNAQFIWVPVGPGPSSYPSRDVAASEAELAGLEGTAVTPAALGSRTGFRPDCWPAQPARPRSPSWRSTCSP
jgi:CRISPR-associated endonuclease/helicase Cas3